MRAFDYASPAKKEEALALLGKSWGEVEVLAGGSDLLSLMKDEIVTPKRLVNIKGIQELHGVQVAKDWLSIGALTTLAEIAGNAEVKQNFPVLAMAAGEAASPQIRNVATLGGNLCQRPRCWYFRTGHGLFAQQDGKSLVLEGDNRYHAILGNNGPAYWVSPSTVAPVLIAYGAIVHIQHARVMRELPLEKFFMVPQIEGDREYDLRSSEIVTGLSIPMTGPHVRAGHYEVRQKEAFDWPYATAAVTLTMNASTVQAAKIVMGHVAPVPWVSLEAAQVLMGKAVTQATAEEAAQTSVMRAKSLGHNTQKIHLARVAVKRAILAAAGATARAGVSRNGAQGGAS